MKGLLSSSHSPQKSNLVSVSLSVSLVLLVAQDESSRLDITVSTQTWTHYEMLDYQH